ncbi:hypothetical protein RS9916_30334 [Synechococcus sp. RS9916]|nr:hypothetical protein RS9916_30334 [Synechococcus sp. RS9916]
MALTRRVRPIRVFGIGMNFDDRIYGTTLITPFVDTQETTGFMAKQETTIFTGIQVMTI